MKHLPVFLVIIPLLQAFFLPLSRVFTEYIKKSPQTSLFKGGKVFIASVLGVESLITWYLLLSYSGPINYFLGGWPPAIGINLFLDKLSLFFLGMNNLGMVIVTFFSFCHIDYNEIKYYTLLAILRAGTAGLCLSGDLFNMYVL